MAACVVLVVSLMLFLTARISHVQRWPTMANTARQPSSNASEIQHYILWIQLKSNVKHPVSFYMSHLRELCSWIKTSQIHNIGIVGDVEVIGREVDACAGLLHGNPVTLEQLAYSEVVAALPEDGGCKLKFGLAGLSKDMVKIWLNKLTILCNLAAEDPERITTIDDANMAVDMLKTVVSTRFAGLQRGRLGCGHTWPRAMTLC